MKYFKIVKDNEFIGACTSRDFIKEIPSIGKMGASNENFGQYVSYEGNLYHDYWLLPATNTNILYIMADIDEITYEQYKIYILAQLNNEEVIIDDDEPEEEPIVIPDNPEPDIMLEYVRSSKLTETSRACRQAIESGFDLELRGETKHFSLTTQDQLSLMSLSVMAQTQSLIPYHADGEETDFYTSEEINLIVEAANALKIQHTTYYNALKTYINALETIEEISAITYGVEIPDEYKSDVLKVLEQ